MTLTSSYRISGVVVAEEYKEILLEAWQQEQQISIEKEIQVRMQKTEQALWS